MKFYGNGIVFHEGKRLCKFNKGENHELGTLETEDETIISVLIALGYEHDPVEETTDDEIILDDEVIDEDETVDEIVEDETIEEIEEPKNELTRKEIMAKLKQANIPFKATETKEKLAALLGV